MKIIYFSILAVSISLTSCGSKKPESATSNESESADHAKEMCECLKDAGLDKSITISKLGDRRFQRDLERKVEKIVPKCLLRIVKEMEEEISDLSKNDKKEYSKSFLKACIETECADIALDLIPYDLLDLAIVGAESEINRQRRYRNEYEDYDEYDEYDEFDEYDFEDGDTFKLEEEGAVDESVEIDNSSSIDFDEAMDEYEAFIDDYIVMLKKALDLQKDPEAIMELAELMEDAQKLVEKADVASEKLQAASEDFTIEQSERYMGLITKLSKAAAKMY